MGEENEAPDSSDSHPDNQKLEHEGWNDLRDKPRYCTDILFLLLLLAAWFAMTMVGFVALGLITDDNLRSGNPVRLTNAMDYSGKICGYDSDRKDLKYGYYLPDLTAVCVAECPSETNFKKFVCTYEKQAKADKSVSNGYELLAQMNCMFKIKSKVFLNRCYPNTDVSAAAKGASKEASSQGVDIDLDLLTYGASQGQSWFSQTLADVIKLAPFIGGFGLGGSVLVAFGYLYLLRLPGLLFVMIWGGVLGVFVCLLVGSWLLWSLSSSWSHDGVHNNSEVLTMRVFAYVGLALTALYFCLIVVLRKRLNLAIGIVKQTARALAYMPTLMLLPLIQAIGITLFLIPWVIYVIFLASSGEVVTHKASYEYNGETVGYTYRSFSYTTNTKYAFLYMLFCWFWTSEFILAFGQLVIALSFTAWYFNRDKSKTGSATVRWAFKATGVYHVGTAAFGSMIIAIIKTIRVVLNYIQRKAKKQHNKIVQYVACIIACIVACIEKIMKFVNKHAYIMTAIYGYSFCKAARAGFFLILRNILRVAAVNMVSSFVLFISRIFIPLVTTFICYLCIAYATNPDNINGLIAPLVFTFLLAYWVAAMFLEIYGMGIETILCCYIADEEMFKVEDRFVEGELLSVFQRTTQAIRALKAGAKVAVEVVVKSSEEQIGAKGDAGATAVAASETAIAKPLPPPGEKVF